VQNCRRIFVAMRRGKTAGMLAAFQGFTASHGGKKTRQDVHVIVSQLLSLVSGLPRLRLAMTAVGV